jgi:hypothetical protein
LAGIGSFTAAPHEYQLLDSAFVGVEQLGVEVVVVVVVVVVLPAGAVSQCLNVPTSGSPNVVLLQATPLVNTVGAVNTPFAP